METGFTNAGWNHDRYADLPSLDAHKSITVADLKGPGIIRHIHITRHILQPKELVSRGVVLRIWFDDAEEPAVQCPLADFFGDGCNGEIGDFSTPLIECVPLSYNAYIPMPFKSRARVVLRNDTDVDIKGYSYVEWENLPEWNDNLGYFHAAFDRKCFQLTKDTSEMLFQRGRHGTLDRAAIQHRQRRTAVRRLGLCHGGQQRGGYRRPTAKTRLLGHRRFVHFQLGFSPAVCGPAVGNDRSSKAICPANSPSTDFTIINPSASTNRLLGASTGIKNENSMKAGTNPPTDEKSPLGSKWAAALSLKADAGSISPPSITGIRACRAVTGTRPCRRSPIARSSCSGPRKSRRGRRHERSTRLCYAVFILCG